MLRLHKLSASFILFSLFLLPATDGAASNGVNGRVLINSEPAEQAVVYLVSQDAPPGSSPSGEKTIRQEELRFKPDFLVVPVGTTVLFENNDNEMHNTHSKAQGNRFDTGAHMPGEIKKAVMKKPGAVPLRCRIHDQMYGLIYVTPSPFFAVTNKNGEFEMTQVPAGKYRIVAWHSRLSPEELESGIFDLTLTSEEVRTVSFRLNAGAPVGSDLSGIPDQDWLPIVDEVEEYLQKAIALWKKGQTKQATIKVMSTYSRLFGESALGDAIGRRLGRDQAKAHEQRLDLFRKQVQGISETTEDRLQKEAEEIIQALRRDAEQINRKRSN